MEARLIALDLDAALVEAAKQSLGAAAGVAWLVADCETSIRGAFDLIIANATFQWLTRPRESLANYYQTFSPGGVLAFSTLGPGTFRELAGALEQAAEELKLADIRKIAAQNFGDRESWADLCPGRIPPGQAGPGVATANFLRSPVPESPPGHGCHQSGAPALFPPAVAGHGAAYQAGYGKRRRHSGNLRNHLGRGQKIIKTVCARTAEKSSCQ